MFVIIWSYEVKPERAIEFEQRYASDGDWAALFARDRGYLGSELYHDHASPYHYLTLDRWESQTAFEEFMRAYRTEYETLDRECEGLTVQEERIGTIGE